MIQLLAMWSLVFFRGPAVDLPSLLARPEPVALPQTPRTLFPIYADERFRFFLNGGGTTGNGPPTFLVCRAKLDDCRDVYAITTEKAVLGCYPCDGPLFPTDVGPISVSWDFRGYRDWRYLPMPVRTSGSLAVPHEIKYDHQRREYSLLINAALPAPYATILRIRASDVEVVLTPP